MWFSRGCALALLYGIYSAALALLSVVLRGGGAAGVDAAVRAIGAIVVLALALGTDALRSPTSPRLAMVLDHTLLGAIGLAAALSTITEQHFIEPAGVIVVVGAAVGLRPAAPIDVALACGVYGLAWLAYLSLYLHLRARLAIASAFALAFVGVCAALHLWWIERMNRRRSELERAVENVIAQQTTVQTRLELYQNAVRPPPLQNTDRTRIVAVVGVACMPRHINIGEAERLLFALHKRARVLSIEDATVVFYSETEADALAAASMLHVLFNGAVSLTRTALELSFAGTPRTLCFWWDNAETQLEDTVAHLAERPGVYPDDTVSSMLQRPYEAAPLLVPEVPNLVALSASSSAWPPTGAFHRVAVGDRTVHYLCVADVPGGWPAFHAARARLESDEALRWALVGAGLLAMSAVFDLVIVPSRFHIVLWFGVAPAVGAAVGTAAWLAPAQRPHIRLIWLLAVYALVAASSVGMSYRTTRLLIAQTYAALYIGVGLRTAVIAHMGIVVAACTLGAIDAAAFAAVYTAVYTGVVALVGVAIALVEQRAAERVYCIEHKHHSLCQEMNNMSNTTHAVLESHVGARHAAAHHGTVVVNQTTVGVVIGVAGDDLVHIDSILATAGGGRLAYWPLSRTLLFSSSEPPPALSRFGDVGVGHGDLVLALVGTQVFIPITSGAAVEGAIAAARALDT